MGEVVLSVAQVKALKVLAVATESGTHTGRHTGPFEVAGTTAKSLVNAGLAEYVGKPQQLAWHSNTKVRITQAGRGALGAMMADD